VERSCQDIVAAEVQDFSPKPFVRQSGYDNNGWRRYVPESGFVQYILPSSVWQTTIRQHNAYVVFVEQISRIVQTIRQVQMPSGMTEDLAKPEAIVFS
jgi:hypothetical protein